MKPYYEDEYVTLYCEDALAILATMDSGTVSATITDPPYSSGARNAASLAGRGSMRRSSGKHGPNSISSDNLTAHGFAMMVRLLAVELLRVSFEGAHLLSYIDWRQWPVLAGAIESAGWMLRACLVWDKVTFGMGNGFRQQAEFCLHASKGTADNFLRHDVGTVFREARPSEDIHPTQKPHGMVARALSCFPSGLVLDPFAGSGTTLVAAKSLGRKAIGIELSEEYCEIAAERLSQGVLDLHDPTP